jgi:hypothetical protein
MVLSGPTTDEHTTMLKLPAMADHIDRYVPAQTNGGWGFASVVIVFTLVLIGTVTYIHRATYRHPTDVTWHGIGSGGAAAEGH